MNNNELTKFLAKGYRFSTTDMATLEKIVETQPWFQLAHHFLAAAKYQNKSDDYKETLNITSIYSPDREILYNYIYKSESSATAVKKEIQSKEPTAAKTPEAEHPAPVRKEPVAKPDIASVKPKIKEAVETKMGPTTKPDGSEIKSKEELREVVRQQLRKIEEERKISAAKVKTEHSTGDDTATAEPDKKQKADGEIADRKTGKKDILERFIKSEPSVNRPKDGPYKETLKLAKESLEEHFDFVSETLAEIYYKQDNPEKAIKIYEQLILKLPEKKLYFAARIKEIVDNK